MTVEVVQAPKRPCRASLRRKPGTGLKRKPRSAQRRTGVSKKKPTSTAKADKLFSLFVRQRDGKCVYPNCVETDIKRLQCSHFWARANSATRYDPDNCVALCYKHHYGDRSHGWEYAKHAEYRDYMLSWLGEARFNALMLRGRTVVKRQEAIKLWLSTQSPSLQSEVVG